MYRFHNVTKTEFNYNLEKYLKINNTKNHLLVGDFNIDILRSNIKSNKRVIIQIVRNFSITY